MLEAKDIYSYCYNFTFWVGGKYCILYILFFLCQPKMGWIPEIIIKWEQGFASSVLDLDPKSFPGLYTKQRAY